MTKATSKPMDLESIVEYKCVPEAGQVLQLLEGLKSFSALRFALKKAKPQTEGQSLILTVTKDCQERPKLLKTMCNLTSSLIQKALAGQSFKSVCSQVGDRSFWDIRIQRVHPGTHDDTWPSVTTHAHNVFLFANRDTSKEFEKVGKFSSKKCLENPCCLGMR